VRLHAADTWWILGQDEQDALHVPYSMPRYRAEYALRSRFWKCHTPLSRFGFNRPAS
jgi:hypothetical protein